MKSKIVFLLSALVFSCQVFSQAKFYASLNTKSIPLNQNFQLNFTIENANGQNLRLPNLSDFQVLSGPNTSQSMQWVNGAMTQSVTYSYILRPTKEGTFKIGKASVNISGATMESVEMQITVTAPSQQSAQQQRRSANPFTFDPFEDPFGDEGEVQEQAAPSGEIEKQIKDNVFLKMATSQNEVYVGEPITATLKLYYRLNFGNVQMMKAPKFDGFWSQEVPIAQNQKPKVENINGQQFYVLEVQKYNLYPQRTGTLQITPSELNMIVQVQTQSKRRSIWDMFNGGSVQNLNYKPVSNAANIRVKEPPKANQPEDYNGAVGQYSFEAKLSAKEAKTDEAITLTLKLSGTGNLKTTELPKPEFPDGFEVFDPKTKEDISNSTSGFKQYDYLIIPRQPGQYKIESVSFSYFDPAKEKYFTLKPPEFSVNVTGAPSQAVVQNNVSAPVSANAPVQSLGKDIRYIKTDKTALEVSSNFLSSPLHYGLMFSPIFLFLGIIAVKRKSENDAKDIAGSKLRKAKKMAKKRLENAAQHLKSNAPKLFYDEVSRAVLGYFSDKLQIAVADLSKENIGEKLLQKNVSQNMIDETKQLLENCEFALYTNQVSPANMEQQYQNAIQLISSLEDVLQ